MRLALIAAFALRLTTAGAQETPEQLIDGYVATGDKVLLRKASTAIAALPAEYRARLLHARILFLSGEADDALAAAKKLNRDIPDELDPYGLITEIALQRGDVKQAETAAQWMLNLRVEDLRSLLAAAAVREAIEDYTGAEEMLLAALTRTSRADVARRAAIGVSMARIRVRQAREPEAAMLLDQVEKAVPGYLPASSIRKELERNR